jgi:drug/metabolite transporter (DMT)-like permease
VAFLVLLAFVALTRPASLKVTWRELPMLAVYGVAGVAAVQWLYFVAIQRLPVGIGLLVEFTAPLWVALWARFVRHEAVRPRVWAALALSLVGLSFVAEIWSGSTLDAVGLVAALFAAFSLAFYYNEGEVLVRTRDPLSLACYAFGFAALFLSVLHPWWRFPFGVLGHDVSALRPGSGTTVPLVLMVLSLVVLGTIVPYTLVIAALRHISATQAGIVGMVEPVVASVVAWFWLGQALTSVQVLGGALVITGVVLAETARSASVGPAVEPGAL